MRIISLGSLDETFEFYNEREIIDRFLDLVLLRCNGKKYELIA